MLRVRERLAIVVPLTLVLIALLLYLNTRLGGEDRRSCCSPCRSRWSARSGSSGSLDYNISIAVWVGHDRAHGARRRDRRLHAALPRPRLRRARARRDGCGRAPTSTRPSSHGAVKRVRPKMMTVTRGVHGLAADHVVDRRRRRRDEADRGADGRRARDVVRCSSCSSTRCSTRSGGVARSAPTPARGDAGAAPSTLPPDGVPSLWSPSGSPRSAPRGGSPPRDSPRIAQHRNDRSHAKDSCVGRSSRA